MLLDPSCPPVESTGAYCRKRDVDTKRQVMIWLMVDVGLLLKGREMVIMDHSAGTKAARSRRAEYLKRFLQCSGGRRWLSKESVVKRFARRVARNQ